MVELSNRLAAATTLRSDELGAVLDSLGNLGDQQARLAAVVALLAGPGVVQTRHHGGAFAAAQGNMTTAFTSGLQKLLRGRRLNEASELGISHRRLRKQC